VLLHRTRLDFVDVVSDTVRVSAGARTGTLSELSVAYDLIERTGQRRRS
jgi:hypothetical protein